MHDMTRPRASGMEARRRAAQAEGAATYLARRGVVIDVAARVFRDRGDSATLRDVAQELGTDRASLYYYVGSLNELRQEIVRRALSEDLSTADEIAQSGVPVASAWRLAPSGANG